MPGLSPRLREVVDALPLVEGMGVLEIGCGPGAAAPGGRLLIDGGDPLVEVALPGVAPGGGPDA